MKYKNIDANATDDNEIINLAHCGDCGYTGNKGMWIGHMWKGGSDQPLMGIVELGSDDTWNLDDIIPTELNDKIDGPVSGEAICPNCESSNFY